MDLNYKLKNWENGQIRAERLAADILCLDGFSSVDPQCPLGGPDGLKDATCEKNGWQYIGAAYFPNGEKEFKEVKGKFLSDLAGVAKNKVSGIVFVTNQYLTPGEREELIKEAKKKDALAIILHFERIRVLLNQPLGYGLRLSYFDIPMSVEEQSSFFTHWNSTFSDTLAENTKAIIGEISHKIDLLMKPTNRLEQRMEELIEVTRRVGIVSPLPSDKKAIPLPKSVPTSNKIDIDVLCMLHRALMLEYKYTSDIGILRDKDVWIGSGKSNTENASFVPASADDVKKETQNLLLYWSAAYPKLIASKDQNMILEEITKFHHTFLRIHPFFDGNGRMARFLLMQQANELMGFDGRIIIEDSKVYWAALNTASSVGEMAPLKAIITQAILGIEEV